MRNVTDSRITVTLLVVVTVIIPLCFVSWHVSANGLLLYCNVQSRLILSLQFFSKSCLTISDSLKHFTQTLKGVKLKIHVFTRVVR